ncbi:hypothetical protein I4U23_021874 [Adineta vaga]|nr:hypothetical protein I4U23_021874 [Adineta vaga]
MTVIDLHTGIFSNTIFYLCNYHENCSYIFVLDAIEKYRSISYENLTNGVRSMLINPNDNNTSSSKFYCFSGKIKTRLCEIRSCYALVKEVQGNISVNWECGKQTNQSYINIQRDYSFNRALYELRLECNQSLCNNGTTMTMVYQLIIREYQIPGEVSNAVTVIYNDLSTHPPTYEISTITALTNTMSFTTKDDNYSCYLNKHDSQSEVESEENISVEVDDEVDSKESLRMSSQNRFKSFQRS